jgi:hypothetical protein
LTCVLDLADNTPTSPAELLGVFRSEWGDPAADRATITAATEPDGSEARPDQASVILSAESETGAWAYAAWAVAKAAPLGIESVEAAGRLWQRSTGEWEAAPSPSEPVSQGDHDVIVHLA